MRTISITAPMASLFVLFAACGPKQDATQQANAAPTGTGGYAYPPQQPGYPQQGAYPQTAPTYAQPPQTAPMPTGSPTAAPPAAGGGMAVPGPVAFTCTNDVPCGTHHCNTQYGKCAFPCQTNVDCITPNACVMGLCVPQMPQAAPAH